jgi:ubiquinone/menaquinone biosynthesis C-methylase UbiE
MNQISEIDTDVFRKNLSKYTKKAYQMLPQIKNPCILDIGCGSGVPTIELAKLSKGKITAIDTNQFLLNKLKKKIRQEKLSKKVIVKNQSIFEINFPNGSFDIIWAEGIIHIIGFEASLKHLRKLLIPNGFFVIHDSVSNLSTKLRKIPNYNFRFVNHFELPKDAWWKEYYQPLEKLLLKLRKNQNVDVRKMIKKYQTELDWFKRNPKENNSAFYIFQKKLTEARSRNLDITKLSNI